MSDQIKPSRSISILREDVSRKIAAGEVIDRPFSVVRELLDNAIDAQSRNIDVFIEGGGIAGIRMVDDGEGMSEEDLRLCFLRYATSKIREEDDLYRVSTLGFRGEALASIAACSRLSITSMAGKPPAGAHRVIAAGGRLISLEGCAGKAGTVVEVADLFFNMPVRKKFLKNPGAETAQCRQTLLEKALPFPEINFKFFTGGSLKHFFPAQGIERRISSAFGLDHAHLSVLEGEGAGFRLTIVAARPEICRRDKKMIQVFVNRRRIYTYGLIQAVEYAYSDYMPGGSFPAAFVLIDIDPELVDFNIHPAKREVRFRDIGAVHQGIVAALRSFLKGFDLSMSTSFKSAGSAKTSGNAKDAGFPDTDGISLFQTPTAILADEKYVSAPPAERVFPGGPKYCGQIFKLFLLVEYAERLFIIDQHAAHERIIFEKLKKRPAVSQQLLVPIRFEAGEEKTRLIKERGDFFKALGIKVECLEAASYEITALPEDFLCLEDERLIEALLAPQSSLSELEKEFFNLIACRLAVKEGEEIDSSLACELIRRVFELENARCPHGRPLWYEISREELFRRVGRG